MEKIMELFLCTSCKKEKIKEDFHKHNKNKKGIQGRCKECDKKWHHARYLRDKEKINLQAKKYRLENKEKLDIKSKEWKIKNPDKVKKYQRITNLRREFNLEVEDYNKMYKEQNGKCFLCGEPETFYHPKHKKILMLSVDHCHKNGKIRKLLCRKCNNGLGLLKDSPELLRKAADYIESHN